MVCRFRGYLAQNLVDIAFKRSGIMVDFPASIALDGCRNAYLCLRQAQHMNANAPSRIEDVLRFSRMAKDYSEMVQRNGSLLQRWRAKWLLEKVALACKNEGVNFDDAKPSGQQAAPEASTKPAAIC